MNLKQQIKEINDLQSLNLTTEQLKNVLAQIDVSQRSPEDTLKWLSQQYTKMYHHIMTAADGNQPNYQLVANFLEDAPQWNYELVEYFTHLATLQAEL